MRQSLNKNCWCERANWRHRVLKFISEILDLRWKLGTFEEFVSYQYGVCDKGVWSKFYYMHQLKRTCAYNRIDAYNRTEDAAVWKADCTVLATATVFVLWGCTKGPQNQQNAAMQRNGLGIGNADIFVYWNRKWCLQSKYRLYEIRPTGPARRLATR